MQCGSSHLIFSSWRGGDVKYWQKILSQSWTHKCYFDYNVLNGVNFFKVQKMYILNYLQTFQSVEAKKNVLERTLFEQLELLYGDEVTAMLTVQHLNELSTWVVIVFPFLSPFLLFLTWQMVLQRHFSCFWW